MLQSRNLIFDAYLSGKVVNFACPTYVIVLVVGVDCFLHLNFVGAFTGELHC